MPTALLSIDDAELLGPGVYVIQMTADGSFAVGVRRDSMTMISALNKSRFYCRGPLYFKSYGSSTITAMPERLPWSESHVLGSAWVGGGGGPLPEDPPV